MRVMHRIELWFVVQVVAGMPLFDHFFCHGQGPETRCSQYELACVFDDPRADVLCPRTFDLDFEVTEEGGVRTFYYCTPQAWSVTWPGLERSATYSEACITIEEMILPWDPDS